MATRSDFAQKLLTDLQMRKERMAGPAFQSTSRSKGAPRDSYGDPTHQYRGSRQTKSLESATNPKRRSNHGARSLAIEESSNQLVRYGSGRNSEQLGDLSRALAFAFGNRTKSNSSSNNPVLSFLHRIGSKVREIGKMERRNSINVNKPSTQTKNLSSIHINEISKGAQKLNQILRACSSGISFDGHSVEISRELLKGAMDLEESLRMLANVQEASEKVINPKRKSRIKLLDENGEEKEEETEILSLVSQQKLVERPRFSFDKPSRNSHSTKSMITNDTKQHLMAITYSGTSNVTSHKRSASCVPDFRSEKGRMPNVIAKLMGLDEVPQSVNIEVTPSRLSSKQKDDMGSMSNANKIGKTVEKKAKNSEYLAPTASGRQPMQNHDGLKSPNRKPLLNGFERVGATKMVSRSQVNEESHQFNKSQNDLHLKTRRDDIVQLQHKGKNNNKGAEAKKFRKGTSEIEIRLEKGKGNTDSKENPRVEKREKQHTKEKHVVPNKRSSKQLHDEKPFKVLASGKHKSDFIRNDKFMNLNANTRNLMFGTSKEKLPERKYSKAAISYVKEEKHIQMHKPEGSPRKDEAIMKIKRQSTIIATENPISTFQKREQLIPNKLEASAVLIKEAEELPSAIVVADLPTTNEKNSERNSSKACISNIKKEKHIQMREKESSPRQDEGIMKTNGMQQKTIMDFENPISTSQKEEQLNPIKSETSAMLVKDLPSDIEAEELQIRIVVADLPTHSKNDEAEELQNPIIVADLPTPSENEEPEALQSPNVVVADLPTPSKYEKAEELQSSIVADLPTPNKSSRDMATEISTVPMDYKGPLPGFSEDTSLDYQKLELHSGNVCYEASFDHSTDELLAESEIHLKDTLLKSRLFLNTVDTLFNLSIPDDRLNETEYIYQDDDSNVMLDCAYEIMRRKGMIKEQSLCPSLKTSVNSVKVTSFNDLVKQLQTDFEKLEVFCTSEDQDTAECIHEMLEKDIQNREPGLNFMWDLDWDEAIIERVELVKDVERYLFDGVVNDIAKELLNMNAYV